MLSPEPVTEAYQVSGSARSAERGRQSTHRGTTPANSGVAQTGLDLAEEQQVEETAQKLVTGISIDTSLQRLQSMPTAAAMAGSVSGSFTLDDGRCNLGQIQPALQGGIEWNSPFASGHREADSEHSFSDCFILNGFAHTTSIANEPLYQYPSGTSLSAPVSGNAVTVFGGPSVSTMQGRDGMPVMQASFDAVAEPFHHLPHTQESDLLSTSFNPPISDAFGPSSGSPMARDMPTSTPPPFKVLHLWSLPRFIAFWVTQQILAGPVTVLDLYQASDDRTRLALLERYTRGGAI